MWQFDSFMARNIVLFKGSLKHVNMSKFEVKLMSLQNKKYRIKAGKLKAAVLIGVVIATKWRYYLFYLQQCISALRTVLPKSFTGAFSSNDGLNVREVEAKSVRALSKYFKMKFLWLETVKNGRLPEQNESLLTCNFTSQCFQPFLKLVWKIMEIAPADC